MFVVLKYTRQLMHTHHKLVCSYFFFMLFSNRSIVIRFINLIIISDRHTDCVYQLIVREFLIECCLTIVWRRGAREETRFFSRRGMRLCVIDSFLKTEQMETLFGKSFFLCVVVVHLFKNPMENCK